MDENLLNEDDLTWGLIFNHTVEKIIVYGDKKPGEIKDNSSWVLGVGKRTKAKFDCDGFFVPHDRIFAYGDNWYKGPIIVKFNNLQSATLHQDGNQYIGKVFPAIPPFIIHTKGQVNWDFKDHLSSNDIQKMNTEIQ